MKSINLGILWGFLVLIVVLGQANAGTIALTSVCNFSEYSNGSAGGVMHYKIVNNGDSPAYGLLLTFSVDNKNVYEASFKDLFPNTAKEISIPLALTKKGDYLMVTKIEYSDTGSNYFFTIAPCIFVYKSQVPHSLIITTKSVSNSGNKFSAVLSVTNIEDYQVNGTLNVILPKSFSNVKTGIPVSIPPKQTKDFTISADYIGAGTLSSVGVAYIDLSNETVHSISATIFQTNVSSGAQQSWIQTALIAIGAFAIIVVVAFTIRKIISPKAAKENKAKETKIKERTKR